jgi:hypothetical protein
MTGSKMTPLEHFQRLNLFGCRWETLGTLSRDDLTRIIYQERMSHRDTVKFVALWRLRRLDYGKLNVLRLDLTIYSIVFPCAST